MRQEIDARPEENDELCPPVPLACVSKVSARESSTETALIVKRPFDSGIPTEQLDAIRRRSCGYE
jgi:hypothetical protein